MKKIIILCMSCYKNTDFFNNIEWVRKYEIIKSKYNIECYRVLGKNNISIDSKIPMIECDVPDTYEYLISKLFYSIRKVYELHEDLDYLIKVDDDVEIDIDRLVSFIENINYDYIGKEHSLNYSHESSHHFGKCNDNYLNNKIIHVPPFRSAGGPLYILSKKSVIHLKNNKIPNPYDDLLFEDIYVSQILFHNGIELYSYEIYSDDFIIYQNDKCYAWHNYNKKSYSYFDKISY